MTEAALIPGTGTHSEHLGDGARKPCPGSPDAAGSCAGTGEGPLGAASHACRSLVGVGVARCSGRAPKNHVVRKRGPCRFAL